MRYGNLIFFIQVLYMWTVETGQLIKSLDAHFARINQIKPLICNEWNCVITSSMDRTIKVWNLNNIFEEVHHIDRLETQIDSISMSADTGLAVTASRGCIGVWDILTGKLQARLANSAYGAIVSHAIVTKKGDYILAGESGFIIYWKVSDKTVAFNEKQPNILQVMLFEEEQKSLVISQILPDSAAKCVARTMPAGQTLYEFSFPFKTYKNLILTSDGNFFIGYGIEKGKDSLYCYSTATGELNQKFQIKYPNFKEASMIVSMPNKPFEIGLIDQDGGCIINSSTKKLDRCIPTWGGKSYTS